VARNWATRRGILFTDGDDGKQWCVRILSAMGHTTNWHDWGRKMVARKLWIAVRRNCLTDEKFRAAVRRNEWMTWTDGVRVENVFK
jgi:hypothetical protein